MSGSLRRIRWRSSPCPSVQSLWFATQFPGGASRLAALLLAQILPVSSLVAPCDPGAAPRTYATIHWDGTLDCDGQRRRHAARHVARHRRELQCRAVAEHVVGRERNLRKIADARRI